MTGGPVDLSKAPKDKHPEEPPADNLDFNYQKNFRNHLRQTHAKAPLFNDFRAEN